MKRPDNLTIPNILSAYRLTAIPVIIFFIITGKESLYFIFMIINLLTDLLDGFLARRLKQETELGAKLDAFADNFTYLFAFIGIFVFKLDDIRPHLVSFIIMMVMLVSTVIIALIKFRKFPSYHLYSGQTGGYVEGAFFIVLFTVGFFPLFYYVMLTWAIVTAIECIAINLMIPEMRSDIKSLYQVIRERRAEKKQSV